MNCSVYVIAWPSMEHRATMIAEEIKSLRHLSLRVTVVADKRCDHTLRNSPDTYTVEDPGFFGAKLSFIQNSAEGDFAFIVHADTFNHDFAHLIQRGLSVLSKNPAIGIWVPNIANSPWSGKGVVLSSLGDHYDQILQPDLLIAGVNRQVLQKFKEIPLSNITYGWGVDWILAAFCNSHGLGIIRDKLVNVFHQTGSGYSQTDAHNEMEGLFSRLDSSEVQQIRVLQSRCTPVTTDPHAPKVSVIVPCYNQGCFLADALLSVQSQTLQDIECIIVDDGSNDETESVARTFCNTDPRFRYINKTNGGLSSARNFGLGSARGQFIQFLDSDDLISSNKLELQYQAVCHARNLSIAISDYTVTLHDKPTCPDPAGIALPISRRSLSQQELVLAWEVSLSIPIHSYLFPRSIFESGVLFDTKLPNHEDFAFLFQVLEMDPAFVFVADPSAFYRRNLNSLTKDHAGMRAGFIEALKQCSVRATQSSGRAIHTRVHSLNID